MVRAFDHIVIAGHDLTALRDFYHRIGFQVGRRNIHPWGTENHIIQFDGVFLELIGLPPEGQELTEPAPYFAAFVRDYLSHGLMRRCIAAFLHVSSIFLKISGIQLFSSMIMARFL